MNQIFERKTIIQQINQAILFKLVPNLTLIHTHIRQDPRGKCDDVFLEGNISV